MSTCLDLLAQAKNEIVADLEGFLRKYVLVIPVKGYGSPILIRGLGVKRS
jgi:hypothetical protein